MTDNDTVQGAARHHPHPLPYLIAGALLMPTFFALLAWILVKLNADMDAVLLMSASLTGILIWATGMSVVRTKYGRPHVAMFATMTGMGGGICFVGLLMSGSGWWCAGGIFVLMTGLLTLLFADLDDDIPLWGIVAAMAVAGLIPGLTLHYLAVAQTLV